MPAPGSDGEHGRKGPPTWVRLAGAAGGLALVISAIAWLAVHQLKNHGTVLVVLLAALGVVLLYVSLPRRPGSERWPAAVAAFLAAVLTCVQLVQAADGPAPAPATTVLTPPGGCEALPQRVEVRPVADLQRFGLAFPRVTVAVTGDRGPLYRRFAGTIAGQVPPSSRLVLIGWADPNSHDSTAAHHPGSGLSKVSEEVDPDPRGCWATKRGPLAYPGARGLAFEYTFTLVPEAIKPQFDAYRKTRAYQQDGLTGADFGRFGLQRLATFRVET